MATRVEQVTPAVAGHGEGPVWDAGSGRLLFVDMHAGDVLALDDGGLRRHRVGDLAAALRPRAGGGFVVATARELLLLDELGASPVWRSGALWDDAGVRMNDGGCDPQGRFWCGSMATDESPGHGSMWRLDPDGRCVEVLDGLGISNGLAWRPDGTAVYVDSITQRVDVLVTSAQGEVLERRPFVEVPDRLGAPDGLVLDADGGVWVALHGGSAVHRYDSAGRLSEVVPVPTRQPTACTFGGPGLDELYVTTSRVGLGGEDPLAGALFMARPGVTGLPVLPFAG